MDMLRLGDRKRDDHRCRARIGRLVLLALVSVLSAHWLHAEEMSTRFYAVEAGMLDSARPRAFLAAHTPEEDDDDDDDGEGYRFSLQEYFEGLGVAFPQGSRIGYDCRTSRLIVTNTRENLEKVERIVEEIDDCPPQVCLDARVLRLPWSELERVTQGARVPASDADSTVLLLRGATVSGNTMLLEETAGAGPARLTVTVTPTVAANSREIDLELSVVLQRTPHDPTKMETKIIVEDGVPWQLSCSGPHVSAEEGDAQRYLECLTVTATLVTPSGALLKESRRYGGQPQETAPVRDEP